MLFARFLIFTLIQCPGTTNNSCGGVPTAFFFIAWNLATRVGNPFVNFKLLFFNVKCNQKLVNLGNLFLSTNSDPTVIDMFFALHVSACILFSSYPCFVFFLRCLFWLPSVVSCRNPYIEYGWTPYMCQWLPYMWQLVWGAFCELQTAFV